MQAKERRKFGADTHSTSAPQAGLIGACTAALGRMAATLRDIGSVRPPHAAASDAGTARTPGSSTAPHLSKLTDVVESAAQHVERAEQCHRGAGIRIDAALYELDQLRMELQFVVDPALLQGTSRLLDTYAANPAAKTADPSETSVKAGPAGSARSAA